MASTHKSWLYDHIYIYIWHILCQPPGQLKYHSVAVLAISALASTVKPVFLCAVYYCEFCDLGTIAKITGCEYSTSQCYFIVLLGSASKKCKIEGAKIMQ